MVDEIGGLDGTLNSEQGSKQVKVSETNIPNSKLLMLYFVMVNCPPCKAFTPLLAELYNDDENSENKNFDVVAFIVEKDADKYNEYQTTLPFHVMPHKDSRVQALGKKHSVKGLPRLIVLNAQTGDVVNGNAKDIVEEQGPAIIDEWIQNHI